MLSAFERKKMRTQIATKTTAQILNNISFFMLTSIIFLSNCIADWGDMQAGFQTMALPLLIVIIMAVLVNYINHFIIRQRAKEFATYMLLGMKKISFQWYFCVNYL